MPQTLSFATTSLDIYIYASIFILLSLSLYIYIYICVFLFIHVHIYCATFDECLEHQACIWHMCLVFAPLGLKLVALLRRSKG